MILKLLHNSLRSLFLNYSPLSVIMEEGIPYLHMIYFVINRATIFSFSIERGTSSTHFVKYYVAIIMNLCPLEEDK